MNVRRYLWVALCVALGVMLLMAYLQRRRPQPASATSQPATQKATRPATRPAAPPASQAARTSEPAPAATRAARVATSAATAPAAQATWRNDTFAEHERSLGSLDPKGDYTCQVQLTSRGAAIRTVKLAEYFMTVRDKRRYHKEPKTYDQAVEKDPKLEGHYLI